MRGGRRRGGGQVRNKRNVGKKCPERKTVARVAPLPIVNGINTREETAFTCVLSVGAIVWSSDRLVV